MYSPLTMVRRSDTSSMAKTTISSIGFVKYVKGGDATRMCNEQNMNKQQFKGDVLLTLLRLGAVGQGVRSEAARNSTEVRRV